MLSKKYEEGLIFEEGDVIRLRVEFTGRPRPEVSWYHEGELLESSDGKKGGRLEIETDESCTILKLAKANRADRGEYSVKLQSGLGEDSASFLVTVASKRLLLKLCKAARSTVDITRSASRAGQAVRRWDHRRSAGFAMGGTGR